MKKYFALFGLLCLSFSLSCGTTTSPNVPTTGSSINSDWTVSDLSCTGTYTGGFIQDSTGKSSLTMASGKITACSNVLTTNRPTLAVATSLPSGFTIDTSAGDVNATYTAPPYTTTGVGYTFTLHGSSFMTDSLDNFTLTVPYDTSKVDLSDRTSTKLFVRLFNYDDSSLVDINGDVSTGGEITINLYGLPTQFTAVVIYNQYMDAAASDAVSTMIVDDIPSKAVSVSKTSWSALRWCVVYNAASTEIINATKSILGISTTPTTTQIRSAMKSNVANVAAEVQGLYQNNGFSEPLLFQGDSNNDPCGSTLSSTKRYILYLNEPSSVFSSFDPNEVITPSANKYGRVYISPTRILDDPSSSTGSIKAAIADETAHPIENAYLIYSALTTEGYRDGSATVLGMTFDQGSIAVRSYTSSETKLMSDFLTVNKRNNRSDVGIANQDFFAYVGREYNAGSLGFMSGMFNQLYSAISAMSSDAQRLQPPRSTVLGTINSYFTNTLGSSLSSIYLDFLKQRTLEHNANSQFGRSGEVTSGFASNLFQTSSTDDARNSVATITVSGSTCSLSSSSGGFGNVVPFAARAIKITPSSLSTSGGGTVTVAFNIPYGGIGDVWGGSTNNSGTFGSLANTNTFSSFGTSSSDEIDLVFANITTNVTTYIEYSVSCSL